MSFRAEHKFDPARADRLDAPEREAYLPDAPLIDLLALRGEETVIEYGAGTGRLAIAVRAALGAGGRVIAVEENDEMLVRLNDRMAGAAVEAVGITDNQVPEPDGAADRVLAVNLLHEIRGERALEEMLRLLRPDGLLLVADWARGRELQDRSGPRTTSSSARTRRPPSSSAPASTSSATRGGAGTTCWSDGRRSRLPRDESGRRGSRAVMRPCRAFA
jgi:SAM-dependent methyltransferase